MKKYLLIMLFLIAFVSHVNAQKIDMSIVTTRPVVGQKIEVSESDSNLSYRWYVNNEVVGKDNYYIPSASDYESWIEVKAYSNESVVASDKIYFSKLPVVYIDVDPKKEINRSDYVDAKMYIQGNINNEMQYDGDIEIKGRGTSSWHYDKKPYKLKLDKKADLFGFGKSKHYVLLANYLDISELRNTIAYRMADYLGLSSSDTTWVVVIFNDEYLGLYQLAEHVRVGKQLVDITDWEDIAGDAAEAIADANDFSKKESKELKDKMESDLSWITGNTVVYKDQTYVVSDYYQLDKSITNGFLLELDSEEDKEVSNFNTSRGIMLHVKKPEYLNTNSQMFNYVQELIQDYEDAIYQIDGYNEKGKSYTEYVNMDSLVSYWLVNEILANEDASRGSRFIYIGDDDKITYGPVWDFDISSNSFRSFTSTRGWAITNSILSRVTKQDIFREIVKDPYFQVKAQEKYWKLRGYLNDIIKSDGLIDQYTDYLYEAAVKNEMKWVNRYMPRSFSGDKGDPEVYRKFLINRIAWLDEVFKTEDSTTKHLEVSPNNSLRKDKSINLTTGLKKENETYLLNENEDVNLKVLTKYADYKVYVNGIYYGKYSNQDKNVVINYSIFTEKENYKNVITVFAGKRVNYITLILKGESDESFNEEKSYEINTCNYDDLDLVQLKDRKVSSNTYGINKAYYSNTCFKYFSEDKKPLHARNVIVSPSTSNRYWGVHSYIQFVGILGALCIIDVVFIIINVKKLKKCKKKRK